MRKLMNDVARCAGQDYDTGEVCAERERCARWTNHQHERAHPDGYTRIVMVSLLRDPEEAGCSERIPDVPEPCQNAEHMGEHACSNRHQCWEPCGELGHSAAHAVAVAEPSNAKVSDAGTASAGLPGST